MKRSRTTFKHLVIVMVFGLFLAGCETPDTYVYLGKQVPKAWVKELKSMELLNSDEQLKYFYSIGILDIKEGMFFVTDQKLVAYSTDWEEPETLIKFDEIYRLDVEYNDSFLIDTYIMVETKDGLELEFPVSSEKKRDQLFYNYLLEKSNLN